jgi:hypothetical protein
MPYRKAIIAEVLRVFRTLFFRQEKVSTIIVKVADGLSGICELCAWQASRTRNLPTLSAP